MLDALTSYRSSFITTSRPLQRHLPPMRLYEKAKRLGVWNPADINFGQDRRDWQAMSDDERDLVLRLSAMFQAGEEAVTLDLLPLVMAIAASLKKANTPTSSAAFWTKWRWKRAT
jgi:ribonucleoside-diphosphate reductase beta chain